MVSFPDSEVYVAFPVSTFPSPTGSTSEARWTGELYLLAAARGYIGVASGHFTTR